MKQAPSCPRRRASRTTEACKGSLDSRLRGNDETYDFILIDCPPSLGLLTLNALVAADAVLIPLHCEYFALEGLADLVGTMRRVRTALNPSLDIEGVLLSMYDDRTNLGQLVARDVREFFKDKVFDTIIPRNVRLGEAPSHGVPAVLYDVKSRGAAACVALAKEMAADPKYVMLYQYGNPANPRAHYEGTAPEILEELDEIAAFVAGLGTGGTLMGTGRRLKEELGDAVRIVAAEPMQGEPVQGLRSLEDGFIPPIIDLSLLDRKIFVTNRDAIVWTRRLLDEEGIFAGVSSGAIASIAVRIANELDEGNIVFIVCDDSWKYLSSGIYTRPVDEIENLDSTVWW